MQYFNGFSLKNEEYLFKRYINHSEYCICGFSYGSIKALKEVKKRLKNSKRVDTLQLFSPAFFQTKDTKFKRLQILSYTKNKSLYLERFLNLCFYPHEKKIVQQTSTNVDELNELLEYIWDTNELQKILDAEVNIEVYLGQNDCIIDVANAKKFFIKVANITYIKNANHFLQIN